MNEETLKLVEQLAYKLGTTTEYLWSVLIRQAPIEAIINIFYTLAIIISGIGLYKLHRYFTKEDDLNESKYYQYEKALVTPMIIGCLIWVIIAVICFFSIGDIIVGFINPEYWALNKILQAAK